MWVGYWNARIYKIVEFNYTRLIFKHANTLPSFKRSRGLYNFLLVQIIDWRLVLQYTPNYLKKNLLFYLASPGSSLAKTGSLKAECLNSIIIVKCISVN